MKRKIIEIDGAKCNGCGACVTACHEGAIALVDGKAKLMRDDYCDGFGDCLPTCPTGAITFTTREAAAYDEKAVEENKRRKAADRAASSPHAEASPVRPPAGGCPGARFRNMAARPASVPAPAPSPSGTGTVASELRQWPVQLKLVPVTAPIFKGAKLLIAADCSAYAYANFHRDFIRDHVVVVGCPKLDATDYSEKLTEILRSNDIASVHIVRMEVPCCGGLALAAQRALQRSGKMIPWRVTILSVDGQVVEQT